MFRKLKNTIEMFKMFNGVKSLICIRCSECNSLNVRLIEGTLEESEHEIKAIHKTVKHIEYAVRCNDCKAMGVIREGW